MWIEPVDLAEFLTAVRPALDSASADELARCVDRWTPAQLCGLLSDEKPEVRKLACLVLGLVGTLAEGRCLAAALRDEDAHVNEMAEQAMWSIFFRSGSDEATYHFKLGLAAMEREEVADAAEHFHRAHQADPNFAEAYNQCAIAHYMLEEWEQARRDCERAVALLPIHFGALAGLGHCYAQMGCFAKAAESYRRALTVNPRMEGISGVLRRLEESLTV